MAGVGHNSGGIAADRLRTFVERIERVEEEIKASNDDKKEIYAEARGVGFDVAAMKGLIQERRQDPTKRAEHEALMDLYRRALEQSPPRARARARARGAVPHDPETGEITESMPAPTDGEGAETTGGPLPAGQDRQATPEPEGADAALTGPQGEGEGSGAPSPENSAEAEGPNPLRDPSADEGADVECHATTAAPGAPSAPPAIDPAAALTPAVDEGAGNSPAATAPAPSVPSVFEQVTQAPGAVNDDDKTKDLLDIPAFLRRPAT